MDAGTGDAIKTWRFSNMKQWNVNWEIKMVEKLPVFFTIVPLVEGRANSAAPLFFFFYISNINTNKNCYLIIFFYTSQE